MKGMWLKTCILRVLAVCLPSGGCRGGIFRSLGWSDRLLLCHRAVAVSDRLLLRVFVLLLNQHNVIWNA